MTAIPNNKKIVILGGGTNTYISNHLALSAPAYGSTAIKLEDKFKEHPENKMQVDLYLTKMADQGSKRKNILDSIKYRKKSLVNKTWSEESVRIINKSIEELEQLLIKHPEMDTPEEVEALVDKLIADPDTRVIIFNVAMVDYKPEALSEEIFDNPEYTYYQDVTTTFGKYAGRLSTSKHPELRLDMTVQDKIIQKIRKERKDILLVGFKTTCGATKEEQYNKGLKLCKDASANIVFVNDVDKDRITTLKSKIIEKEKLESILKYQHDISINLLKLEKEIQALQNNGLVTPEESSYWYNTRDEALDALVQMVLNRVKGDFVRTTLVKGDVVSWNGTIIPQTFKDVFNYIRSNGGWHVNVKGKTSGHFGIKINRYESICSIRKQNYNDIENVGMVKVITENDKVVAFGAKPSVGDATQRELFKRYPRYDCIIHFHSSLKITSHSTINIANQFNFECGSTGNSDSCAYNTTTNMREYILDDGSRIHAVHLNHHGPNIMFSSRTNSNFINQFINEHWNIDRQTTGILEDAK